MSFHSRTILPAAASFALLFCGGVYGQPAPAPRTAEQQFKNIQALQGTPADQVFPAMQFISASLGVECDFCHVEGKFDADDKPAKKTARKMIAMTLAINKDSFNGRKEITCYSCHRGQNDPVGTPPVIASDAEPAHTAEGKPPAAPKAPTADEIIGKYIAAVGGADALHKINSRVSTGTISFAGHESPIEIYAKAPDKRMSVTKSPSGESMTAFNGKEGWLSGGAGHPAREMSGQEAEAARLDADFYLPTHLKEIFTGFRVRNDQVGDTPAYSLIGMRQGQPPVRLYFAQSNGLLLRQVRYTDTPVGRSPTQIDYADYRDVDGVKVPFRWTLARVNGRFTIQVNEARQNVPVDDRKFVKP